MDSLRQAGQQLRRLATGEVFVAELGRVPEGTNLGCREIKLELVRDKSGTLLVKYSFGHWEKSDWGYVNLEGVRILQSILDDALKKAEEVSEQD